MYKSEFSTLTIITGFLAVALIHSQQVSADSTRNENEILSQRIFERYTSELDSAATVQALLDSGVPGLERELLETIVEIYSPALPNSPAVSADGLTRELELFPAHLQLPDLTGVDLNNYVNTDIVEEARP